MALLREAGHDRWAARVEREILGAHRGHWTFQIIASYDATCYGPFKTGVSELGRLTGCEIVCVMPS
nr:hypothetical protein StreXyl84_80290 [Streptomyces sp. Xyl84]